MLVVLLSVFGALTLTASGLFRMNMSITTSAGAAVAEARDALISFGVRTDSYANPFGEQAGSTFWAAQMLCLVLALGLPFLRPIRASLITGLAVVGVILVSLYGDVRSSGFLLQFGLLSVFLLFVTYVLLSFYGELVDRRRLTQVFSQYIPPELVAAYSRSNKPIDLDGEARDITVMFCDIEGFTTISERLDPRALAQWLNQYFSVVSQVIVRHNGTIDKYMGDSVMAFWGAPVHNDNHARDTLAAAMEIVRELDALCRKLSREGLPEFRVGIGISSGVCNVGNMGSEFRMAYTVVGDTVNVAERLERQTRTYKVPVIVSESTARQLPDMLFRELDVVHVKGRHSHVKIFQPIRPRRAVDEETRRLLAMHSQALSHYRAGEYAAAYSQFEQLREIGGDDPVYDMYLKRTAEYLEGGLVQPSGELGGRAYH